MMFCIKYKEFKTYGDIWFIILFCLVCREVRRYKEIIKRGQWSVESWLLLREKLWRHCACWQQKVRQRNHRPILKLKSRRNVSSCAGFDCDGCLDWCEQNVGMGSTCTTSDEICHSPDMGGSMPSNLWQQGTCSWRAMLGDKTQDRRETEGRPCVHLTPAHSCSASLSYCKILF